MRNNILLVSQILFAIYIIFISGPFIIFSVPFVAIQIVCILVIFWAILTIRLNKHQVSKSVKQGTYLLKEGPYEFIRHPIYTGLLLSLLTYIQEYLSIERGLAFLLFVILAFVRISIDERLNEAHFKHEYIEYKKKTKKLIPFIY